MCPETGQAAAAAAEEREVGRETTAAPSDDELRLLRARVLVMHLVGAFGLLCAVLGPDPDVSDHLADWVLIAGLCLSAVVIRLLPLSARVVRLTAVEMTFWVCATVAIARPTNGVPLYGAWAILVAAYSVGNRDFALLCLANVVGLAIAVFGFLPPPTRLVLWLSSSIIIVLTGVAVRYLQSRTSRLVDELWAVQGSLRDLADHDPLTGLLNRRAFFESAEVELMRARRAGTGVAVVVFDLDHLKQLNDTHGHAAGDQALLQFAAIASAELRSGDLLARLGGEEFALAVHDADQDAGRRVAERIIGALRGATATESWPLSASAGVADGAGALTELLMRADRALYAAKLAGRGRVALALPEGPAVGEAVVPLPDAVRPVARVEPVVKPEAGLVRRRAEIVSSQWVLTRVCALGALVMLTSLLLSNATPAHTIAVLALSASLAVWAAVVSRLDSVSDRVLGAVVAYLVVVVATAVAINDPIVATPYFFIIPAVVTAFYFPRATVRAALVAISVVYGAVIVLWVHSPLPLSDFTTVIAPIWIAALSVAGMREQMTSLVDELEEQLVQLDALAQHDSLTGLLNRRAFEDRLTTETRRSARSQRPVSLVLIDIDHFKSVNDTHGHAAGDAALVRVADALRNGRRSSDTVARVGGEEFALLLPDTPAADARALVDRLNAALAETAPKLTVSAGVADTSATPLAPLDLLRLADEALYRAKNAGRARAEIAGASRHVA